MNLLTRSARLLIPRKVRNWLRSPARSARWMWNEMQFRIGFTKCSEIRRGWILANHPSALSFAYLAQHDDPEQVREFDGFINHCSSGMVLFDIGAHFGLFSLAALH